jgi:hypothetical protein
MERRKVRVGIVIDDEMNGFDVPLGCHWQIGLDHDRHHSAVLGHNRHVETYVTTAYWTATGDAFENTGDFFVGNLRIFGLRSIPGRSEELLHQSTAGHDARHSSGAGAKEGSSVKFVGEWHDYR